MWAALGHLLPIAVAVALSTVPVLATILILLSPDKRRSGLTFLVGWVLGIAASVAAFTALAQIIPEPSRGDSSFAIGISLVVVGLGLIATAIVVWRRGVGKASGGIPKWLAAVGSLKPWQTFGLAVVLNIRPKGILLSAAAGLSLRGSGLTPGLTVIVISIYTVIGASTVISLIVASFLAPKRTERWLIGAKRWIVRNNRIVSILIMIVIGFVIVGNGLTRL